MNSRLYDDGWHEKLPPICPECGYNLFGSTGDRCPECGKPFLWSELRRNAKAVYYALKQAEDVNDILGLGPYFGVAGAAFFLLFWSLGWAVGLVRVVSFLLAIATLGTGLQVFRIRRIPAWADESVTVRPDYPRAALTIALGVAVMVLVFFLP